MAATHDSAAGVAAGVSSTTYVTFPPALPYGDASEPPAAGESSRGNATDRESRNLAEKQRRNTLNAYIKELSALLPAVLHSPRKIDKTGTLRLAANDLRREHVFGKSVRGCHLEPRAAHALALLELLGGFVLTVTCKGVVTVVSPNVQHYLGHGQVDLLGQSLYGLVHPEDARALERHIYPPELHAARAEPDADHAHVYRRRREFCVRLVRASPRSEPPQYETCRFDGVLRRADHAAGGGVREEQVIRRQRVRRDRTFSSSGNDVVFNGLVVVAPRLPPALRVVARSHTEYWTRHLIDGRIVQCDQRVSLIAGYMTEEVVGVSGFTFMHKEDVRWVVFLLRQMYDQSKEFGESCYRFVTASGQFIYLKTKGFLEVDKNTKVVQSFICLNTIVSDDEGKQYIDEMKRKYSVLVKLQETEGARAALEQQTEVAPEQQQIEDPRQLEQVIMHLVTNLPSPGADTPRSEDDAASAPDAAALDQLTIIPPEPATISVAIRKSVSVISQTGITFPGEGEERAAGKRKAVLDSDGDAPKRKNNPNQV